MEEKHGHELMKFLSENEIKEEELEKKVAEAFPNTSFYTCSQKGLSAQELIAFFKEMKKIVIEEGVVKVSTCSSCNTQ